MKKKLMLILLAGFMTVASGCNILLPSLSSSNESTSSSDQHPSSSYSKDENEDCVEEHVDENKDGVCDVCKDSTLRTFDFYAINDLHGKITDSDIQPGVDEMTAYLRQAQNSNPNTVLLSSGDMWQGGSESNLTHGKIVVEWMNDLGFASMTLGNHEYDWGETCIAENGELAEFPFLAINIFDEDTDERVEYCDASVMIEKDGAKIGIIGAMGDCYSSIAADKTKGVYFKTGDELTDLVKAESNRLRAEGADCIVYSLHDSFQSYGYDEELSNGYVDIVFEGHSHWEYVEKDAKGVYHLQDGGDNKTGISKATLEINIAADTAKTKSAQTVRHNTYTSLTPDPIVAELLAKYDSQISIGTKVLGRNDKERSGSELSSLVAQLYLEAGRERWPDKEIVLGGGSINVRSPGYLGVGDVYYGDLMSLYPFDNQLQLCTITGADLLDRFINNDDYYVAYDSTFLDTISFNKRYYIVTDSWNSPYAANKVTVVENYDETTFARDLIAEYIEEGNMGVAKPDMPAPDSTLTIAEAIEYALKFEHDVFSDDKYYVSGTVTEVTSTQYGNMRVTDDAGNILTIYGSYSADGSTRYDGMTAKPVAGDRVKLYGIIGRYNETPEMKNAWIVDFVPAETPDEPLDIALKTIPVLLEMGSQLPANESTTREFDVKGKIVEITSATQYGNMTIEDENGDQLYIYGTYSADGALKYGEMTDKPQVGDTVILRGVIKNYVKEGAEPLVEMVKGKILHSFTLTPISELLKLGNGLEAGVETTETYTAECKIVEVTSETWGNMTVQDSEGNILYLYGFYDENGERYDKMTEKPKAGDTVIVEGVLLKYVTADGVTKIEIKNAVLKLLLKGTENV